MEKRKVSKSVMKRLPIYHAYLKGIPEGECVHISATALAAALELGEVQVRKDLALVSDGGKPKVGYLRENLIQDLEHFLGYDYTVHAILVGAGKLGQALMDYSGFREYGLNIKAGFDICPARERTDTGRPILLMDRLEDYIHVSGVRIGIISVPVDHAQSVCDRLIEYGIQVIWNFTPVPLEVPEHILVQNENLASSIAVITRRLQALNTEK